MTRPGQAAHFELRARCTQPSLVAARSAFLEGVQSELTVLLSEAAPLENTQTRALRLEVERLEAAAARAQAKLAACRHEVQRLRTQRGMLQPLSLSASSGASAAQELASTGLDFFPSEGFHAPPIGPLTWIAVSASGRYLALAGHSGASICEAYCEGFRGVARWSAPSVGVSWISFLDDEADSPEVLLAEGPQCFGWAPFEARGTQQASADSSEGIFLRFRAGGKVTTAARGRQEGKRELVAMCTDIGTAEVWDLGLHSKRTSPSLVCEASSSSSRTSSPDLLSTAHDVALVEDASLVIVAASEQQLGSRRNRGASWNRAILYVYDVDSGRCCQVLHPTTSPGAELRLAYSGEEMGRAWAISTASGVIELYRSEDLNVVRLCIERTPAQTPPAPPTAPPELLWCRGERPLLAVGGRFDAVLLYFYEASSCTLFLQARLPAIGASLPRALAWAPELGVLLAAYAGDFQFWLLGTSSGSQYGSQGAVEAEPGPTAAERSVINQAVLTRLDIGGEDREDEGELLAEDAADGQDKEANEDDKNALNPDAVGRSLLFGDDVAGSEAGSEPRAGGRWDHWRDHWDY